MELTTEIIEKIQEAMRHTKKDGTVNWKDGDEIEVNLAGTFANDRFIVNNKETEKLIDWGDVNLPLSEESLKF